MRPIESITNALWLGVVVVPVMGTGATDGLYLRNAGIPTYGVEGVFGEIDDNRMHGKDERVGVKQYFEALEFQYRLVKALAKPELLLLDRIAAVHPVRPAADERADVVDAAIFQQERRTGARRLGVSNTVGDDRLLRRLQHQEGLLVLGGPDLKTFERQQHRAGNVGELVGVRVARIDDDHVAGRAQLLELFLRDPRRAIDHLRDGAQREGDGEDDRGQETHPSNIARWRPV